MGEGDQFSEEALTGFACAFDARVIL